MGSEFWYDFGNVLSTQNHPNRGSTFTHCVLHLNFIKGTFSISFYTRTYISILLSIQHGISSQILTYIYQTRDTQRFLTTLTKFDPTLILRGTRNHNLDSTIKTSWDQCYCKNYQIPFPTTIHGSKLELKQLRYPENRAKLICMLLETITFDSTVGFPIYLVF